MHIVDCYKKGQDYEGTKNLLTTIALQYLMHILLYERTKSWVLGGCVLSSAQESGKSDLSETVWGN